MRENKIGVLDFGGQYAHLIATKLRNLQILAEILDPDDSIEKFREYKGLILSGSPALSSFDEESSYNKDIFKEDIPILGLCFGHQEIAKHYGGKVEHRAKEYGIATLKIVKNSPIFEGLSENEIVWMSHGDSVVELGRDFLEIGFSISGGVEHRNCAIASEKYKRYGFQFHPEVDDTINGEKMLFNFASKICGVTPDWRMESYKDFLIKKIKDEVNERDVFLLASGGVDSTVCAALLIRALGPERVHLLHIDNGLLRKDESREVLRLFKEMGLNEHLHFRDASNDFIIALNGVIEPEKKRKIIGDTFIKIFEEEVNKLSLNNPVLAQGTIYPDTIETKGTKRADLIKTHHNRVPQILEMIEEGRVIEPLKELYKSEVRKLGEELSLPHNLIYRHPFPGPGLGVRLLCHSGIESDVEKRNGAEKLINEMLKEKEVEAKVLPIKSVGVKADLRCYDYPVILSGYIEWKEIELLCSSIYQTSKEINRCAVLLSKNKIEKISPLNATITRKRLDLLREADFIVTKILRESGWYEKIWQCPTVFLPLSVNGKGSEFIVIRPVYSERGMTARPSLLDEQTRTLLVDSISDLEDISGIALDVTTKPPGTIEWE